jgi:hypothetical protein
MAFAPPLISTLLSHQRTEQAAGNRCTIKRNPSWLLRSIKKVALLFIFNILYQLNISIFYYE